MASVFGCAVRIRRVEQRATGLFLKVEGPAGIVVSIAAWMLDPVTCAGNDHGSAASAFDALTVDDGGGET
ncbi:MAG: hypothetical protein QOG23_5637, partial [Blastocatellia bacterium]|nr:hypothetical protein [Blastocatellia bacterium]